MNCKTKIKKFLTIGVVFLLVLSFIAGMVPTGVFAEDEKKKPHTPWINVITKEKYGAIVVYVRKTKYAEGYERSRHCNSFNVKRHYD